MDKEKLKIIFFGTPEFSVKILETMNKSGFAPIAVVTAIDKPKGRKMKLATTPVKEWAKKNNILVYHNFSELKTLKPDLFIVASFGKILSKEILDIPKHGTLNVHPSLLPELRGPSPIQTAILNNNKETGVTIMLMNEKMDEGAILTQQKLDCSISDIEQIPYLTLEENLAELGGELLVKTIPEWIDGKIKPQPQNNNKATYSKLIKKSDGKIDLNEPDKVTERKIRAFTPWPSAYYFESEKRIIVTKAKLDENNKLQILRIKPEGKNEMDFIDHK